MTERLEVLSFRLPDTREKFHRSLGTMHRLKASVRPREQQRAFELAENGGGDQIRIVGLHSEAFESTFDFVLPQLECVAGRSAEDFGLCRGFQRGGFWSVERKFLEPLLRFAHGDVRDHIG